MFGTKQSGKKNNALLQCAYAFSLLRETSNIASWHELFVDIKFRVAFFWQTKTNLDF